ncbi:MAG: WYL domain-containing protein [Pseudomonadota bacterium]
MEHQICEAIARRSVMTFRYREIERAVEPHLLGYDEDSDLVLQAWQLTGGGESGFRTYQVAKMSRLHTGQVAFDGTRPGYDPAHPTMIDIICKL